MPEVPCACILCMVFPSGEDIAVQGLRSTYGLKQDQPTLVNQRVVTSDQVLIPILIPIIVNVTAAASSSLQIRIAHDPSFSLADFPRGQVALPGLLLLLLQ